MPASTIQLRAFELCAGPKAARLVTVRLDKSISEVYTHLCSVLELDAPLNRVSFHKTQDKRVDTTPLSITAPIGSLGLAHNDIFVVRQGCRARTAQRGSVDHAQRGAVSVDTENVSEPQLQPQQLTAAGASPTLSETGGLPLHTAQASFSGAKGNAKEETKAVLSTADSEMLVSAQRSSVCVAVDRRRMENCRHQFAQHSHLTHAFTMKLFQLLTVLSRACPTVPSAAPHLGPTRSTVSIKDLHREILTEFCRHARLPLSRLDGVLASDTLDIGAVYEALYHYAGVAARNSALVAMVDEWLKERLPPLQPAAQMICMLHEGHEAAYLELALLRLLGQVPTAMTWLCLKNTAAAGGRPFYYSAIATFSQTCPPLHLNAAEIPVLDSAELNSCCVAWGLNNSPYKGHLLPLSCWMWSRLVAALLTGHDVASARLTELVNIYSEWEASITCAS
ncbi:hypothetical protein ABL78_3774 [Leptomonas seymouri]|uniref:Uncharacterized protein n=1 Tax=Leptomonas seymouri TaxID=5684 RepID=A0A0N1I4A8_LEPSE|nr:hypothetical protein ABL78_3774 [Leptomonas seymouri]|eukprot:KPI87121.1 hypothetical protein ABL78_3774 [Leptomonas seymouri]